MMIRNHLLKVAAVSMLALSLTGLAAPEIAQAGANPLPALPSQAAINAVIASGAPAYTSLGVPGNILNSFSAFDAAGLPIRNNIDTNLSVSYIGTGANLTQIAMPLLGAATTALQPNMQTPDDQTAGYIIGGLYQSTTGSTVVVATFNGGGNHIKSLRFYNVNNGKLSYTSIKYKGNKLNGVGGQPSQGDQGAVIANSEVCYAIGLDQVCFSADGGTRDGSVAGIIQQSFNALSNAWDLQASADIGNAVPDLIGANYRAQCAASGLSGAACTPDLIETDLKGGGGTGAKTKGGPGPRKGEPAGNSGTPIAIFHVTRANDLLTFDVNGNRLTSGLPPGDYVVLNANPGQGSNTPGVVGALFLVNANTSQPNYLIQGQAVEGFGNGDSNPTQAAIKDGMCAGWGW